MTLDRRLFKRTIAEALAEFLGQKYTTAKQISRAVDIDPSTAENLRKGHLSVTTLEKALIAEGRELWKRLGEEIFGETDLDYEERVLEARIREAEYARENIQRLRARRAALVQGAAPFHDVVDGLVAEPMRRSAAVVWGSADGARQPDDVRALTAEEARAGSARS